MNYSVYISAAKEVSTLGQTDLAKKFIKHANSLEERKIAYLKFDVLVGSTKTFSGAKYDSFRVIREKEAVTLMFIFKSGENTHRINATLNLDGKITWCDGNLFSNRISVNSFVKLIYHLTNYNKNILDILKEKEISVNDLQVINRTFYI
jgi:hypothetical protein